MSQLHTVLDSEELAAAIDSAPLEAILAWMVRRGGRLCALAEAAHHEAGGERLVARVTELANRCAASATECRNLSEAVKILAPLSAQDNQLAEYARLAVIYDRLTQYLLGALLAPSPKKVGHA